MKLAILCLLLSVQWTIGHDLFVYGPYAANIDNVSDCPNNHNNINEITMDLNFTKYNETAQTVTGFINLKADVNDDVKMTMKALNSDSTPNKVFINEKPFCIMMNEYLWPLSHFNVTNYRQSCCPIPRGSYQPRDFFYDLRSPIDLPWEMVIYSKLQVELKRGDISLICKVIELTTEERNVIITK